MRLHPNMHFKGKGGIQTANSHERRVCSHENTGVTALYDKTDVFYKHNAAQKKPDRIGITHVIIQKHSE